MIGTTLGHYKVTERIGAGGMGVVYKARDLHLGRFVAVKILPPEKVTDLERKRRFVQEAKAASALNHPNIVHVYDIDQADGTDYIAMEYVEGKTFDQRIGHRGLHLNDALKYAVQIADALAKAHSAGIVHRDLKPTNIMVNEDGVVKVLDFGLAKLTEQIQGDETASKATVDGEGRHITEEGVIVGTVAYMSPEQAEGKKVDARSDIFSLGSVLYEMVTGQKAFHGTSKMSTLAAILHQEPKPVSGITPTMPAELERLINRCLRKDPAKRFQHMDDVKIALEELKEESDSGALEAAGTARPRRRYRLVSALAVAVMLLAIIAVPLGWYLSHRETKVVKEPLRIVPFTSLPGMEQAPKFSPDGKFVAFRWNGPAEDNWDIYVKQFGRGEPHRLTTDPAEDFGPVWSPDGSEIAFMRVSGEVVSIYIVPCLGGVERKLCEKREIPKSTYLSSEADALSWSPDGHWLAFSEQSAVESPTRICLLSLDTRQKTPLTSPPAGYSGDFGPEFSPDGKRVAFARTAGWGTCDLWTQLVSSVEATRITHESYQDVGKPAWTPDGHELVFPAGDFGRRRLLRVALTGGTPEPLAGIGESAGCATIFGNRMVYVQHSGEEMRIWRRRGPSYRGTDRSAAPLMISTRSDSEPEYSPDGKKIAFNSDRSGSLEVWICDSDGTKPVQLTNLRRASGRGGWSPDGKQIAFDSRPEEDSEIYIIDADGGSPRRLTYEKSEDTVPFWSRDGQWIYFSSNRSGSFQIWKLPSEGGKAVQITKEGGYSAMESFDGKMLYYLKPSQRNRYRGPIWKVPGEGGEESPVLGQAVRYEEYALSPEGIYFSTQTGNRWSVEFFSFHTGKITAFYQEETPNRRAFLAMSPDGQWLLYGEAPPPESDLMLVENLQ